MHQEGHSFGDWAITSLLAIWGFIVGHLSLGDAVTFCTLLLVMLKLVHEGVLFYRTVKAPKDNDGE